MQSHFCLLPLKLDGGWQCQHKKNYATYTTALYIVKNETHLVLNWPSTIPWDINSFIIWESSARESQVFPPVRPSKEYYLQECCCASLLYDFTCCPTLDNYGATCDNQPIGYSDRPDLVIQWYKKIRSLWQISIGNSRCSSLKRTDIRGGTSTFLHTRSRTT